MDSQPVRMPDSERRVRRSLSLTASLAQATDEQARKEGHKNFSYVVQKALRAYLNRENDVRAA